MMNPTSNKKDFDELSTALKDLAYSYIEKYSPSKQQLKVYLMKKVLIKFKSTKSKKEISELIDKSIICTDISFEMCKEAVRKKRANVICCDAEKLPIRNNSIDGILSTEMIYYLLNI